MILSFKKFSDANEKLVTFDMKTSVSASISVSELLEDEVKILLVLIELRESLEPFMLLEALELLRLELLGLEGLTSSPSSSLVRSIASSVRSISRFLFLR